MKLLQVRRTAYAVLSDRVEVTYLRSVHGIVTWRFGES